VKILHSELVGSAEHVARFLRESRLASGLRHPNIVTVFDSGSASDGAPYLVTELLDGEDMQRAIAAGKLRIGDVLAITLQLLDALGSAHAAGIVHRDVKPENVFLVRASGERYTVKLLDFGLGKPLLATDVALRTTPGIPLGSPQYMSPEQAFTQNADGRSDLWAVGALIFHALTGAPPYHDEEVSEIFAKLAQEPAPSLAALRPDLPQWLASAVDRSLERDPARRFQTAEEMASALRPGSASQRPPGGTTLSH